MSNTNKNINSPLEDLMVDETEVTSRGEAILAKLIKPYVSIGKNTKKIVFREASYELPAKLKVILLFLGKLAGNQLGIWDDKSVSQKEAIDFFSIHGVPEGTIKVNLKQLRDSKLIVEVTKGRYITGFDKIIKIQTRFKEHEEK